MKYSGLDARLHAATCVMHILHQGTHLNLQPSLITNHISLLDNITTD